MQRFLALASAVCLCGCAELTFHQGADPAAMTYLEPAPYLFVAFSKDCVWSATPLLLPGKQRSVSFRSGYGSANLSVTITNGMIASVGQQTDTEIPATITALTGLATAFAKPAAVAGPPPPAPTSCKPTAFLYQVVDGKLGDRVDFSPPP